MSFLRKTLAIQTIVYSNIFQYRYVMFFWILMHLLGFIALYFLWTAIFRSADTALPYTLPEIITYYIMAGLVGQLTESHFEYEINDDIRQGTLNNYIMKPFSYIQLNLMRSYGWHSIQFFIAVFVFSIVIFFLRNFFILNGSLAAIGVIVIFIILAAVFYSFVSLFLGSLAFWMDDASLLFNIREVIMGLLSGALLPIDFFPSVIQHIFQFLPFQYLIYTPVNVYLGRLTSPEIGLGIGVILFWDILIGVMAITIWRKGLKQYEGVGI